MSHLPIAPARLHALAAVVIALAAAGCSTPTAPLPPNTAAVNLPFRQDPAAGIEALDAATWRGFGDAALDSLVERARTANPDVRIAAQRVREARAGSTVAASRLWPTLAVTGSLSDQRSGLPDEVKRGSPDTQARRIGIDLGWEVDVFGAASAAADAADLDVLAAVAGEQTAQWLAGTEMARQYLVWQGARLRLQQLQALLQAQQDTERLTRSRQAAGLASRFDVSRATGEAQALAAQLPPTRTLVAVSEHQINVLLGRGPGEALPELNAAVPPALPEAPPLRAGQPIELLQRRPDLRVAQQQLMAEAARLRQSEADLWPKFFIAAALGQQGLRLNLLDLTPVRYSTVALAFAAPLFNAGRLRAAVEGQTARERTATLRYERAVLAALQDVENSLVALQQERERVAALAAALDSRRSSLRHAESLHREGQIDLLDLLDAQRALRAAELADTDTRTLLALSAVQLVKALGGGWLSAEPVAVAGTPVASSVGRDTAVILPPPLPTLRGIR